MEVRTVERDDDDGALFATSDPARVICRLETGACTADDDAARVLLADHPEVEARLQSHMDHVRQRAWRAVAQRDRETAAARRVLANAEPGLMVAFQDLFPADRERMRWELHSGLDDAHPLREHIESLLVVLGTRERSLRARWVDYDLILQCVGYYPPMSHGAHFDHRRLIGIASASRVARATVVPCAHDHTSDRSRRVPSRRRLRHAVAVASAVAE